MRTKVTPHHQWMPAHFAVVVLGIGAHNIVLEPTSGDSCEGLMAIGAVKILCLPSFAYPVSSGAIVCIKITSNEQLCVTEPAFAIRGIRAGAIVFRKIALKIQTATDAVAFPFASARTIMCRKVAPDEKLLLTSIALAVHRLCADKIVIRERSRKAAPTSFAKIQQCLFAGRLCVLLEGDPIRYQLITTMTEGPPFTIIDAFVPSKVRADDQGNAAAFATNEFGSVALEQVVLFEGACWEGTSTLIATVEARREWLHF